MRRSTHPRRAEPRAPRLALLAALIALAPARPGAQAPAAAEPRASAAESAAEDEGPLRNDVDLRILPKLDELLQRGDRLLENARAKGGADGSELAAVFDAWLAALDAAPHSGWVSVARAAGDPAPSPRLAAGLEWAVDVRLASLRPAERAVYVARADALASALLRALPAELEPLADFARRFPGTPSARAACLKLVDVCLERGDALGARTWIERGQRHALAEPANTAATRAATEAADANDANDATGAALARRAAALASDAAPAAAAPWESARLALRRAVPLTRPNQPPPADTRLGQGVQPGIATRADGGFLVQTQDDAFWFASAEEEPRALEPRLHIDPALSPDEAFGGRAAGGWRPQPLLIGELALLVVGRASSRGPNALAAWRIDRNFTLQRLGGALAPSWVVAGVNWWSAGAAGARQPPELAALELGEFQPQLLAQDGRLYAQVQTNGARRAQWLVALELGSGRPLWARELCEGAPLNPDEQETVKARLGLVSSDDWTGAPGAIGALGALAPTLLWTAGQLGSAHWLDAWDGRPRGAFACQRRKPGAPGSLGATLFEPPERGQAHCYWSPPDSDHAYALGIGLAPERADALRPQLRWLRLSGAPAEKPSLERPAFLPLAARVAAQTAGLLPFEADATRLAWLDQERSPARVQQAGWPGSAPAAAARVGPELPIGERFAAPPLLGRARVAAASQRALYVWDRARELALLQRVDFGAGLAALEQQRARALPTPNGGLEGGSLAALGEQLLLAVPGWLLVFGPAR